MLRNLGVESMALGFVAGSTGESITRFLQEKGCRTDFITLPEGMSRINVKLKSEQETEINGQGPYITEDAIQALYEKLDKLKIGDVLVLGGSIPHTLPSDMYERILARLYGRGISTAVDATGELLLRVLKYHPFLIKPNETELAELCCRVPQSDEELVCCARELQAQGARNVLLSLAERGGMLVTEQGEIHGSMPPTAKPSIPSVPGTPWSPVSWQDLCSAEIITKPSARALPPEAPPHSVSGSLTKCWCVS